MASQVYIARPFSMADTYNFKISSTTSTPALIQSEQEHNGFPVSSPFNSLQSVPPVFSANAFTSSSDTLYVSAFVPGFAVFPSLPFNPDRSTAADKAPQVSWVPPIPLPNPSVALNNKRSDTSISPLKAQATAWAQLYFL